MYTVVVREPNHKAIRDDFPLFAAFAMGFIPFYPPKTGDRRKTPSVRDVIHSVRNIDVNALVA